MTSAFPQRFLTGTEWTGEIATELLLMTSGLGDRMAKSIRRRAIALRLCASKTTGNVCASCGTPQPRSGNLGAAGKPCHARSCPSCARKRAAELSSHASTIIDTIKPRRDWGWRHIVLTSPYDPTDPADLSVDALKSRVGGLRRGWRAVWKKYGGADCGAWATVEIAGRGNVHLHALFWGPYIKTIELQQTAHDGWDGVGFVKIKLVTDLAAGAKEIAAYSVKSPGSNAVDWIAGIHSESGRKKCINPILAARWELALFGVRIGDKYGLFRKITKPELTDKQKIERDRDRQSCSCGVCSWERVTLSTIAWVYLCKRYGVEPLGDPLTFEPLDLDSLESKKIVYTRRREKNSKWIKKQKNKLTRWRLADPANQTNLKV